MQYIFLDGARVESNADLHAAFIDALALDEDYGANLDALHDVLTDRIDPLGIIIANEDELRAHLGRRANGFFRLLRDLQQEGYVRLAVISLDAPETL